MKNTNKQTTKTMEKEVLGDWDEKKLQNRIKYNYYKTLYSNDFTIDINPLRDRIEEDLKKQNIKISEREICDMVWSVLHQNRYELLDWIF